MDNGKKFDEGVEHIRIAEKSLKTSFLKWKPDYDSAADEYSKAAVCFKSIKSYSQCRDAYEKAANCYKQTGSLFQAAKCLEQVIFMSKEMNDVKNIANIAEEASRLYQHHGSADTAALLLEKTGNMLTELNTVDALRLFQKAADVALMQDNIKQAADFISKTTRILVKLRHYDEAVSACRREIGLLQQIDTIPPIGRLAVILVLIHLAREDYVAAEKAFKEWGNCCEAAEVQTLESLLQAYDEEDPEGVKAALESPFIKHMDVEYARLARELPLPKGVPTLQRPESIRHNVAPSYVSQSVDTIFKCEDNNVRSEGNKPEKEAEASKPVKEADEDTDEGLC